MPVQQLHLFAPPKPLVERLGEAFFRAVPRAPGVYVMTDREERVLYIGQSGNLRARLGSYKNARPDRVPRKVIRLVRAVERITWERCESAAGARLRENELLRLYRPKFNRMNTWPSAYNYIRLRSDEAGVELGLTHELGPGGRFYGAFKARSMAGYAALLRLAWAAFHQPTSPYDYPSQLLGIRPPRHYRFDWEEGRAEWAPEPFLDSLRNFLAGTSDHLLHLLGNSLPPADGLSPFQRVQHAHDLEVLTGFYSLGPHRNAELIRRHKLASPLILREELDDLLVQK